MSDTFERPAPRVVTSEDDLDIPEATPSHVFGLAGLPGCGKSTAAEIIESELEHNFERAIATEVSDFVRTMFEKEHQDDIDDNELGRWAADKKDEHGNGYFVREMAKTLDAGNRPHVAISGLRSPEEAEALRDVYDPEHVTIIGVWTLPDIRFERKYGATPSEEHPEWETFTERNERETHDWGCVEFFTDDGVSDYIVPNNGGVEDLEGRITRIVHYEALDAADEPTDLAETPFPDGLDAERVAQYL